MYEKPLILPAGDRALVVEIGDGIDPDVNRRVHGTVQAVEAADLPGVVDLVPTYRSLLVYYDPLVVSYQELESVIIEAGEGRGGSEPEAPRVLHIPIRYGGVYGPDLEFVAEQAQLTAGEVVSIHSGTDYLVYMIGFSPGFPYLGGMDARLAAPRLATPRTEIPAGSVGIAEAQTGLYPVATPGGWRLIGRTPLKMFDATGDPPSLLKAGDYVRFVPMVSDDEYVEVAERVALGAYRVITEARS